MKKSIFFFAMLFVSLAFFSCDDEDDPIIYIYQETQCADVWGTGIGNTEIEVETAVGDYLTNEGIEYYSIDLEVVNQGQACLACDCLSGREISVEGDSEDQAFMENLGFVVQ